MNSLKVINGESSGYCPIDEHKFEQMIQTAQSNGQAIKELTASIQILTNYHKETTRWLLIVVCVIALGKQFIEMARDVWGHNVVQAAAK